MTGKCSHIKDMNHLFQDMSVTEKPEGSIPSIFVLYSCGPSKLAVVKVIKSMSGLGLKSSKDLADECSHHPVRLDIYIKPELISEYRVSLTEAGCTFRLDGLDRIRNKKLMDLGIFDREDMVTELSLMMSEKAIMGRSYVENKFIKLLSYLSEEQLKQIYIDESDL